MRTYSFLLVFCALLPTFWTCMKVVLVDVCPSAEDPFVTPNTFNQRAFSRESMSAGFLKRCTPGGGECGTEHWCHVGLVPSDLRCCPGRPLEQGTCADQPVSEGEMGAPAPAQMRWFFDETIKTCRQFSYKGRKGNQNNFLTFDECAARCRPAYDNPCTVNISMPVTYCSPQTGEGCNLDLGFCHRGATPETTICCPYEDDPCLLPRSKGDGPAKLDRWYYNEYSEKCRPFKYSGMRGNANNFITKEDCEQRCSPNLCGGEEQPFRMPNGLPQKCSGLELTNSCPMNHFCSNATDPQICCPMSTHSTLTPSSSEAQTEVSVTSIPDSPSDEIPPGRWTPAETAPVTPSAVQAELESPDPFDEELPPLGPPAESATTSTVQAPPVPPQEVLNPLTPPQSLLPIPSPTDGLAPISTQSLTPLQAAAVIRQPVQVERDQIQPLGVWVSN